jgi:hypothetical protein
VARQRGVIVTLAVAGAGPFKKDIFVVTSHFWGLN